MTAAFQISVSRHVCLTNLGAVHIPDWLQYYMGVCFFSGLFSRISLVIQSRIPPIFGIKQAITSDTA